MLTDTEIRKAKAKEVTYRMTDGRGLYLSVTLAGDKPSLTPERAGELRARISAGEKKAAIAREFGISRETLYQYARATT